MADVNSICQALCRLFLVITAITITLCTKANAGYLPVECTPEILWLADPLMRDNVNGTLTGLEAVAVEMFQNANYYALTMQFSRLYGGFSRGQNITDDQIFGHIQEIIDEMMSNNERHRVECLRQMLDMSSDSNARISDMVNTALTATDTTLIERDTYKGLRSRSHLAQYVDFCQTYMWIRNDQWAAAENYRAVQGTSDIAAPGSTYMINSLIHNGVRANKQ